MEVGVKVEETLDPVTMRPNCAKKELRAAKETGQKQ